MFQSWLIFLPADLKWQNIPYLSWKENNRKKMVKMIVPETKFKGPKPSPALIYMNQSIDTGT